MVSPTGATYDYRCFLPAGVSEGWESPPNANLDAVFRLTDGGRVEFTGGYTTSITDPYGQKTKVDRTGGRIYNVIEPGVRYLTFTYGENDRFGVPLEL